MRWWARYAEMDNPEVADRWLGQSSRGAGCRIMAENDCTPHEIAAVSGHRTLKEVERYTHAADRKRLAARAQAKVAAAGNVVPLAVVGR